MRTPLSIALTIALLAAGPVASAAEAPRPIEESMRQMLTLCIDQVDPHKALTREDVGRLALAGLTLDTGPNPEIIGADGLVFHAKVTQGAISLGIDKRGICIVNASGASIEPVEQVARDVFAASGGVTIKEPLGDLKIERWRRTRLRRSYMASMSITQLPHTTYVNAMVIPLGCRGDKRRGWQC